VAAARQKLLDLVADIDHVEMQVAVGAIVERPSPAALEVDKYADFLRQLRNAGRIR
jgi:hypothetical protein